MVPGHQKEMWPMLLGWGTIPISWTPSRRSRCALAPAFCRTVGNACRCRANCKKFDEISVESCVFFQSSGMFRLQNTNYDYDTRLVSQHLGPPHAPNVLFQWHMAVAQDDHIQVHDCFWTPLRRDPWTFQGIRGRRTAQEENKGQIK